MLRFIEFDGPSLQVRTAAVRALQTSAYTRIVTSPSPSSNVQSKRVTDSSDLFFACDDQSASAAAKDLHHVSAAINSFLAKAGSNFELEITSTLLMTSPSAEVSAETTSYNFNLLLARGASFSQ